MNIFYEKFSFILIFIIFILFFNMLIGEKATEYFLWLVLLSMIVSNIDSFKKVVGMLGG